MFVVDSTETVVATLKLEYSAPVEIIQLIDSTDTVVVSNL